jgi:predicted transcriptional regulator
MHEDEDVLDHRTRRMVYNYISSHPGVSFQRIRKVLDLNSSTLRYHLKFLEKSGKVVLELESGKKHFYPRGSGRDSGDYESRPSELTKKEQRVLDTIKRKPGISKRGICNYTNLNRNSISRCINTLRDRKLIWKVRSGRSTGYEYITKEKLKQEMLKLLIDRFLHNEIDRDRFLALKRELENDSDL